MSSLHRLIAGVLSGLVVATVFLVVLPYIQLQPLQPPDGLRPYTEVQLRGRQVYIEQGCVYCHSQQPRDVAQAPDAKRGWGRAPVPADYYYDKPHQLGTMRTGPDLFNIGARQPSITWHLGHLYQPRAYMKGSIMPAYPYLFEIKEKAELGDTVVTVPREFAPKSGIVVARRDALDLVQYLIGMDHTYPAIVTPKPASGASH
jgi:cytochrome c oxidase cbb3-type subunit 2